LKKNKRKNQKEAKNGQKASWPQGASLAASHARGQQVLAARLWLAASWQPPCGFAGRKLAASWPQARGLAGRELAVALLAASSRRPCWPLPCGLLPQGLAASKLAAALRPAAARPRGQQASWPLPCGQQPAGLRPAACRKAVGPPSAGRGARGCLAATSGRFWDIRLPYFLFIYLFILVHSAEATCQHLAPLKITPYKYPATTQ